jgi:hypothetical protein
MDEVTAALVDQRAITGDRRDPDQQVPREIYSAAQVLAAAAGMNIHRYTSLYIRENKVELRLGTYA